MGGGGGMFGGSFLDIGKPIVSLAGFSEGGIIPGIRSHADDQLILAQKGEAVLTHRAVDLLGERTISLINKGRLPQFSEGGIVGRSTLGLTSMPTVANRSINSGTIDKPAVAQTITNNSSVHITMNSDGSADVRGDRGDKLGSMLSNAVKAILIQESRPGGIIGSQR